MPNSRDAANGSPPPGKTKGLVVGTQGKLGPVDVLNSLHQLVDAVRDSIQIHETGSTQREKLKTYREVEIARVKASETTLREYFDHIFEERRQTHKQLFEHLNRAVESGDIAAVQTVVGSIVDVARTSPLASIGNLAELRRALDDPDTVFEL